LRTSLTKLQVRSGGAVALISGRTLAVVEALFAPLKIAIVGSHGAEMRLDPFGPETRAAVPVPDAVRHAFADLERIDPRIIVEDKAYTLAFHYRAAMAREKELLALAAARIKPFAPEFVVLHGKAIIEIKSAQFDKGNALATLLTVAPFAGRRPIFFGDDTTDQDAFDALPKFGGIGVSVGRRMAGAEFMLPSPRAVRTWVANLANGKGARE
jgi:trehalose 6-phosphate phosphatase